MTFFYLYLLKEPFKFKASTKVDEWMAVLGKQLIAKHKKVLFETNNFVNSYLSKLEKEIENLDDVRSTMESIKIIKDKNIWIDLNIEFIEVQIVI